MSCFRNPGRIYVLDSMSAKRVKNHVVGDLLRLGRGMVLSH